MQLKKNNNKVLLHTCCAICSGYPIRKLQELEYEPIAYFFNPNIYPDSEYQKRLESQKRLCDELKCELIVEDYTPNIYMDIMQGFDGYEEGSARCKRCSELRLLRTIQKAKELEIDKYTTSISISPHKSFTVIKDLAKFFAGYFQAEFIDIDFREQNGFLKTNQTSKELNLYRQNYCGCETSMQRLQDVAIKKMI